MGGLTSGQSFNKTVWLSIGTRRPQWIKQLPKEAHVYRERPRIIRPPHEADNYFLPLTGGCSNSQCGFCNYYYERRLQVRDLAEVLAEIDAVALFVDQGEVTPGMPEIV